MSRRKRLLALASYSDLVASTRFRLTQLIPYLHAGGWDVRFQPFVEDKFLSTFYEKGNQHRKAAHLAARSVERLALAVGAADVDAVLVQREAALIGPPYAEFILRSLKRFPLIFDFDDALWELNLSQSAHPFAARLLKDPRKCWYSMRRAHGIIAGSSYLGTCAHRVNDNVIVVPTVVSSHVWTPSPGRLLGKFRGNGPPRIGWIGTHTTADQLKVVEPALRQLRGEGYDFELHIVGASSDFRLGGVELLSRPWRLRDEIQEFQRLDIGLAPMHDVAVGHGKCGFKQLQYMAVGVPFVSSWVGGACDFVIDGENGLVARTTEQWYSRLKALLESQDLRRQLSQNGRALVERQYCIEAQGPRVVRFVEDTLSRNAARRTKT